MREYENSAVQTQRATLGGSIGTVLPEGEISSAISRLNAVHNEVCDLCQRADAIGDRMFGSTPESGAIGAANSAQCSGAVGAVDDVISRIMEAIDSARSAITRLERL